MDRDTLLDFGPNAGYLTELYQLYLVDPSMVEPEWAEFFKGLEGGNGNGHANGHAAVASPAAAASAVPSNANAIAEKVVDGFRRFGHLAAKVSPIVHGGLAPLSPPELTLAFYGSEGSSARLASFEFGGKSYDSLSALTSALQQAYCGSIGFEIEHLTRAEERQWLQQRLEARDTASLVPQPARKRAIFNDLMKGDLFEAELHRKYVGAKRFSCEGTETILPSVATAIEDAAAAGIKSVVIGMAHRGRLNLLANITRKPLELIFREFDDQTLATTCGAGDVKYHMGYETTYNFGASKVEVSLAPNPSHLEFVNPVVEGIVRAQQDSLYGRDRKASLPLLLHGDAAFAGQGIVFEAINFSGLSGYSTGGTLHIITNNQIGFTTTPDESRSTRYCTDLAKGIDAPVFHVNCEDPEAACWVTSLALEFRNTFGKDVFVDLIGHRKHGHNEGDDPSFTQPLTYAELKGKRPIWEQYGARLVSEGIVDQGWIDSAVAEYKRVFGEAQEAVTPAAGGPATPLHGRLGAQSSETAVDAEKLKAIARSLTSYPDGFVPHGKLSKILEKRVDAVEGGHGIEWGVAEALAFGSLLSEGRSIRLSGQDCGRGTFSQRHLSLDDVEQLRSWSPLETLAEKEGRGATFEVYNSSLSEAAVLGFEFGYASVERSGLTMWEAQFGDFANGAQVIIDQFISSSEAKWHQLSGVTMLLPHGYEGQGPEHSSARLERYLQMCAESNMRVCYPSTSAQHFHMLRRQGTSEIKRPLIVMTPKSLLRLPAAASPLPDLASGGFEPVIDDNLASGAKCSTLVFMTGKVFHDAFASLKEAGNLSARLVRIEELYPFPEKEVARIVKDSGAKKVVWLQEEPRNMGAWGYIEPLLRATCGADPVYVGRPASAGTSTGSPKHSAAELKAFLAELRSLL
jgi:2-oxoglutarate dehydrogenase E1 component